MSSFTFYPNIPQPGDNPSMSQGEFLQNFTALGATNSWTTQDHYGFGTGTDGLHKQITFPLQTSPSSPTNPSSILYTAPGSASTNSQLAYKNASASFLVNGVRAFGAYVTLTGSPVISNGYNIASISASVVGTQTTATITLNSNVTTTDNVCVFLTANSPSATYLYTFSSGVLTIITNASSAFTMNFAILQA